VSSSRVPPGVEPGPLASEAIPHSHLLPCRMLHVTCCQYVTVSLGMLLVTCCQHVTVGLGMLNVNCSQHVTVGLELEIQLHQDIINSLEVCVRNERILIISASADCTVQLLDVTTKTVVGTFGQVFFVSFTL